jgi:Ala-tRNA(Pro) deacylase
VTDATLFKHRNKRNVTGDSLVDASVFWRETSTEKHVTLDSAIGDLERFLSPQCSDEKIAFMNANLNHCLNFLAQFTDNIEFVETGGENEAAQREVSKRVSQQFVAREGGETKQGVDLFPSKILVYHHPPVYTCEEATNLCPKNVRGGKMKNLFVKDKKKNLALLSALEDTKVNLKGSLKSYLAENKELSIKASVGFANNDELFRHLGLVPGSVTAFGIVNNVQLAQAKAVQSADELRAKGASFLLEGSGGGNNVDFFLDKKAADLEFLAFHPNACNATVSVATGELINFFEKVLGRRVHVVDFEQDA